jgi:formamidopyrimidine-DNA glycosylase
MPELPDVEAFRRYIEKHALHQAIRSVEVRDPRVLDHIGPPELERALMHASFESTDRYGKHLFVILSSGRLLTMHFGMTDGLIYLRGPEEEPRFTRVLFLFDDQRKLAFADQRILGRIGLASTVADYVSRHGLGPDALSIACFPCSKSAAIDGPSNGFHDK